MFYLAWYRPTHGPSTAEGRGPPDPKTLQDVQLCAVFEAHTKYERKAANEAWTNALSGYPAHIEW